MTTEREMLDLLHRRYSMHVGNGPRYVVAEHVRSSAGFDAQRSLDAMVLDLWPSHGLAIHGFEIKCSRSDWLRELADPTKAGAFTPDLDYMWLVVASADMVKPGELPKNWGLLSASRGTLVSRPSARRLRPAPTQPIRYHNDAPPMPRTLMAALARSIARTATHRATRPPEVAA